MDTDARVKRLEELVLLLSQRLRRHVDACRWSALEDELKEKE